MPEIIEMGTISSRGQISIPNDIRKEMGLKEGSKVLFFLTADDSLLVKRVSTELFAEITKPLREAKKKIRENQVNALVHKFRSTNRWLKLL